MLLKVDNSCTKEAKVFQSIIVTVSQVMVLIVLMIVRFDRNYKSGPVGDWEGGDFLGKVDKLNIKFT